MAQKTIVRGLRDIKLAKWTAENTWETAIDLLGARRFTVELTVETDELRGDDVVLDRYAKIVAVQASIEYAAVDLEALEIMSGGTLVSNADYEDLLLSAEDLSSYFGIAGRIVGTQGRDVHLLIPKARISGNLGYQAQEGQYLLPSVDVQGVYEGTINGFGRVRNFASLTALDIPLATTPGP